MRIHLRLFCLLVLLLAGCAPRQKHVPVTGAPTFIHPLPAVFQAHLDLRRCPPTSFELVLRPDGMYYLQMERKGSRSTVQTAVQAEVGVWRYNREKKILRLGSYSKTDRIFSLTGKNTLKLLKVSGGMMPSLVRYDFTLKKTKPDYKGVARMQGMYSRKRGRGFFRECLSGEMFPLASGRRTTDIERSYQDILHGRDESLLVTLDMQFATGSGRHELLVPVRSVALDPYHSCQGKERRIATIANNRWYLTELAGKAVPPESMSRLPFLKVQSSEQLIQGFAGCNNFTGSWLFADNDFVFSRIQATRMACPFGMEIEDTFLQALDDTRRYAIKGDTLSLHDRQGRVLARFRYSRQLTELDFRYPAPDQDAVTAEEEFSPDDIARPESHRVETGGAVPASVVRTPVREVNEKILPLPEEYGDDTSIHHKITVLKAKKKVAVGAKRHAVAQPAQTQKEVAPAPQPLASPGIQTEQKQEEEKQEQQQHEQQNKQQNDKAVEPPPAPVEQEKSVVGKKDEKIPAENGITVEPTSAPQINQQEEREPAPELSLPTVEKNGPVAPPTESGPELEAGAANSEGQIPVGQPVDQAEMQAGPVDGATTPPALPPIPEEDEGKLKKPTEPTVMEESSEPLPVDEASQQGLQEENKKVPAALPSPEVMSQELQEEAEKAMITLPEEGNAAEEVSPPGEEKKPAPGEEQTEIQDNVQEDTAKEIAPPVISTP